MSYKQELKLSIAIITVFILFLLCGFSFIGVHRTNLKADTNSRLYRIQTATTVLNEQQGMTALDIHATIGHVTILYGDKPQIEIGATLTNHASFSNENGTLIYCDDFDENNLSFDDTDSEEYKIAITIPSNLDLKTLSVDVGIGSINLQNIMAGNTKLSGSGKINLDGFRSETLDLNSTLTDINATGISISKEFNLRSFGSTAIISGDVKGNVLIDSAGISNTDITFFNSDSADYYIKGSWEPEASKKDFGNFLLENGKFGLLIDGKKYSLEDMEFNPNAANKLTVISRELMPIENITIKFVK